MNRILELLQAGQSIWYDNIQRSLITNGSLARMILQGEIRGVTSNPSIFMNAITKTQDYDQALFPLAKQGASAEDIFYQLAIEDVQSVADLFLPMYLETGGADGYVSLEVNPYLAHDTDATLTEARRLWQRVDRPNLMVKIPATLAGLPAVSEAIADGINVNVTLIFARQRYAQVMEAYMRGLEMRLEKGLPIDRVASVASFFVSRVDTNIDIQLQNLIREKRVMESSVKYLFGKAAVANACLAYADFHREINSERFQRLLGHGARYQRPLWASTSTKNPDYRDVMYIEELVAAHTVNTVPPQTLVAFLEHGQVRPLSLQENLQSANQTMADLEQLGISIQAVTQQLENEGVQAFSDAFTALIAGVEQRRLSLI